MIKKLKDYANRLKSIDYSISKIIYCGIIQEEVEISLLLVVNLDSYPPDLKECLQIGFNHPFPHRMIEVSPEEYKQILDGKLSLPPEWKPQFDLIGTP